MKLSVKRIEALERRFGMNSGWDMRKPSHHIIADGDVDVARCDYETQSGRCLDDGAPVVIHHIIDRLPVMGGAA